MTQIISGIVDIEPTPTALVSAVQLSKSTAPLGTYNFGLFVGNMEIIRVRP